ncbi:C25 family cysteine peptidase [Dyadobacter sp. CY347]|uniref:putative type IX secretion system sortase PorU2 n=1 Tax=Dyadobacter sp. CY347 TaxID=2909336 RepID=UPI001F33EE95|nr:C25 family cysteine peptidase [Dyadobacter sp. CY347]MCF2490003.1 C25 family cysteine peptidase [Dyadobacter sp. CY347]
MNKFSIHTLIFLFSTVLPASLLAQKPFGNEWIVVSQTYLRIPVVENGFYKITNADFQQSGFPVDSGQFASFQMFWHGKEVPIQISADDSNRTEIIFHGKGNDGALDSALYISPNAFPHSHYSLYSDTSAYFLTHNADGVLGKRVNFNVPAAQDSLDYYFTEVEKRFTSHYAPGKFYPPETGFNDGSALSAYDVGEGWTGPEIRDNASYSFSFNISNAVIDKFSNAEIELVLIGRSAGNHAYALWSAGPSGLNRKIRSFSLTDFESIILKALLDSADVICESELGFFLVPAENEGSISLSYAKVRYPQRILSENINPVKPMNILKPRLVRFSDFDPQAFNYLIITHPAVRTPVANIDPVAAYAAYRASKEGGGYKPLILHSEDIYDQFYYGEPGPAGIRNIISWMAEAENLKFVFLIGRSVDPQTARKSVNARTLDMVPNAGWPGSDIALVMGTDPTSGLNPIVPIGRLNALNSQQVYDYLLKVKAVESEPPSAKWHKNILHLSGGRTADEIAVFSDYVRSFEEKLNHSTLGAHFETISKTTTEPVEKIATHIPVNKGVGLITIFGHSSLDVTDIDIGLASDSEAQINNHPRYPAIIVNGCAAGSIFYSTKTLSSDWILTPNKGAVLFLAHTFNGLSTDLKQYTNSFYEVLADSNFTNEAFGIIQNEAIRRNLIKHKNITAMITAQQMVLHGDPAIRIFPRDSTLLPDKTQNALPDIMAINVSPNPSNHWFRFFIEFEWLNSSEKVSLFVYDLWGRKVKETSFEAHFGKNEWFWHPENLPSGVYIYKLKLNLENRTISPAAQNALQGKLIWLH